MNFKFGESFEFELLKGYFFILAALYFLIPSMQLRAESEPFHINAGQQLPFEFLSIENGLSQVTVLSITQDHRGFMWFGTRDGLNKYDGYNFTVYRHDAFDSTSLSNNRINVIAEDHQGILWIGTDGGLNIYDRDQDWFKSPEIRDESGNDLNRAAVHSLLEDDLGNLWIGSAIGLVKTDRSREKSTKIYLVRAEKDTLPSFNVQTLFKDRNGILWIGTAYNGLFSLDPKTGSIKNYLDEGGINGSNSKEIHAIFEDSFGGIWVGTSRGLNKFDRKNNTFREINPHNTNRKVLDVRINAIYESKSHLFWIGTSNGLRIYNPTTDEIALILGNEVSTNLLGNNELYTIFEDNSEVLWMGTFGTGIVKYDPLKARFAHYLHDPRNPNTISDNFVYALLEDEAGELWIGTNDGLNRFNRKTGRLWHYRHSQFNVNGISDNRVRAICQDSDGYIWVGTYQGLNQFDKRTGKFRVFKHIPGSNSLSQNTVVSILEDKDGYLWIGTNGGGLNKLDRKNYHFTVYRTDPDLKMGLTNDHVFKIYEDNSGLLWLGTYGGGLNSFNPETEEWKHYIFDLHKPNSISSNYVYSILQDKTGFLWIGTYGSGLNRLDPETGVFKHFEKSDGLPNDVIYGILNDNTNHLWLSTNYGLSRIAIDSTGTPVTIKNYDKTDGLQSNEFNFGSYYRNSKGEMFFGGVNGFNVFYPDSIKSRNFIPPIVLTGFEILHKSVEIGSDTKLKKSITETVNLELDYKDKTITFEFAALDFSNPEKNMYAYKLEGTDTEWIYRNADRRYAQYTNLSGGKYVFHVIGTNSDGVWNKKGLSLPVEIYPPYWDTYWFKGLMVLIIILMIFVSYRLRVKGIRTRSEELRKMNLALSAEIKERRSAEDALKVSEEKYRTITDNINAGIYRNMPEGNGKFIEVNPAFAGIFGFESKEEVLQSAVDNLYYDKKQRNKFMRKIRKNGFVKDEEILLKKADGSPVWCSITAVAVRDKKDNILYYDGLVEDISERKKVRQALIESEEKYRILVERARDGILIIKHGIVFYVNSKLCQLSGYAEEEILGSPFLKYVHSDERDLIRKRYESRLSGDERDANYETTLVRKDGKKIITEINAGMITYEGESADLVFLRDVTERKQLENQIRQSQKMEAIGHLAGGVAHDFNNILTVINGHGELALLRMRKNHKAHKHVSEIVKSAQRASDLIRQLLAFSRQQIIEPRIIDVNQVIESLDKMLHRVIGEDIDIISNLTPDLPPIKADPGQIEQVLMNLIINARDAINDNTGSKNSKQISIETRKVLIDKDFINDQFEARLGPHILISISDTGKGIDKETLKYIFDPFFTTKEKGKGTGLGLATVFGIVKQNEGSIFVDTKPGKGTKFDVYWPYVSDELMPEEQAQSDSLESSGHELVLIVEDDIEVRNFTKQALESKGYGVIEATNGLEALDILETQDHKIDLIISDVVMPEMGGQELAEKIKQDYPDLRLILVSGYTDSQIIRDGTRERSVNFIYKPYSIETLVKRVRDVLDA